MDEFTQAYIETALWSTLDPDSELEGHKEHLDAFYDVEDIAPETLEKIKADCAKFQAENGELITEEYCLNYSTTPEARAGHDFWLTRCGHGAGFLDGDWDELAADSLYKAAERFGECDLYPGDDGKLYIL